MAFQSTTDVNHALILRRDADGTLVDNPGRREFNLAMMSSPTIYAHFSAPQTQLHAAEILTTQPPGDPVVAEFSHEVRSALGAIYNGAHVLRVQRSEAALAMQAGMLIERQDTRAQQRAVSAICAS